MDARKLAPDLEWVMHDILRRAEDASLYDCDGEKLTAAEAAYRAFTQRNELRAILEPLLDKPFFGGRDGDDCGFCEAGYAGSATHSPDCPALEANKNRLLGRA
jgi:hypothetical protein